MGKTEPRLHISSSIKIVARHRNKPSTTIDEAREEIVQLAERAGGAPQSDEDRHLIQHLEETTGLTLNELATLTRRWPRGL